MDQILIADDDNIDRKLLETYLHHSGYDIVSTTNGKEAWEVITSGENPPQIVIIDWLMPIMDGITLCKKIRGMEGPHYIYIILVTGKSMSADMVQGLEAGADDYLTKPYEKAVLLARINVGARIVRLEREKNEQLKRIKSTNLELRQNMEAAVQIQLSLLPPKCYHVQGYQFDWIFKPSDMLGGDMLHVYKLSDTKVACYVLDVSGHGTEAALLSVTIRNQLTVNSNDISESHKYGGLISLGQESDAPLDVIRKLADHYGDLLEETGHYFTIVYGILDTITGTFNYISAGHHNPILIRDDQVFMSKESGGAPIGMFRDLPYTRQQFCLSEQDRLYLYSDGLIEQTNQADEQYGISRFSETLKSKAGCPNPIKCLINDLRDWANQDRFRDDIALIEISRLSASQ